MVSRARSHSRSPPGGRTRIAKDWPTAVHAVGDRTSLDETASSATSSSTAGASNRD